MGLLCLGLLACRNGIDAPASQANNSTATATPVSSIAPQMAAPSAMDAHVVELRERMPKGFTMVIEPPFVVVGDESPDKVRERTEVVRWAVRMLKQDFFERDPEHIIDIWLFGDARSYRENALALFGEEPSTPYGYYSAKDRALVMNIATGGGTLVHEIVHPFMEANVRDCPPWINEGMGSLYEQSAERDGRIVGLTNWRLAGLQRAIRQREVPLFSELAAMGDGTFYGDDSGTHYASARYLLYYLQEQGLLRRFFQAFLRDREDGGYRALQAVLGEADMVAFQRRWERYVLDLTFP
ncbi:MAG TPA: hypothetical protein VFB62_24420 [Polyangiaceae bacterium]|nr:hypothetical protein [Polyangiaceae bacterium]